MCEKQANSVIKSMVCPPYLGGFHRQTKDDAILPQAYTCYMNSKAVHSCEGMTYINLLSCSLEAPQIWRMKRYNVLETELVYTEINFEISICHNFLISYPIFIILHCSVGKIILFQHLLNSGPDFLFNKNSMARSNAVCYTPGSLQSRTVPTATLKYEANCPYLFWQS